MLPPGDSEPTDDVAYQFWSRFTAAQARNTGWSRERVSRRVVRCFEDLCVLVEPTLSLELGAHQATFSAFVKSRFPDARCVAVEANPYVHDLHRDDLAAAGIDYRHAAVAAEDGVVTLNIPTNIRGKERKRTNRMASLAVHVASTGHEEVEVAAVQADHLAPVGSDERVVAWIDVEGAADQVLSGARSVLARAAAIFIEVERTSTWHGQWLDVDVARYFEELGKIPVARDIERPHQYNVIFVDPALATRPEAYRRLSRVLIPRSQEQADGPSGE